MKDINKQFIDIRKRVNELQVAFSSTLSLLKSETFKGDEVLKNACQKYIKEIERLEQVLYTENEKLKEAN